MRRIILLALLAVIAWIAWGKYEDRARAEREAEFARQPAGKKAMPAAKAQAPEVSFFTCDPARTTCKQMTSCEEARYYIKTCPGFNSGVFGEEAPCEKQWCRK